MKKLITTLFAAIFPLVMMAQGWPANYGGVMLQSFEWDGYDATKWTALTSRADELSNCFDLIWVPNSAQCGGGANARNMGYSPVYYLNQNTIFGTEEQLRNMISTYKAKGTGFIADVVINHKNGATNWIDFPNESVGSYSVNWVPTEDICCTDECNSNGYHTTGAQDTGDDFDGCRDLDHTKSRVQDNMITYQKFLLNEIGYVGVRLDMVKGYSGEYTKKYNQASNPTFSVGEYWDPNYNAVMGWVNATGKTSAAFDFPLKYVINNAVGNGNYGALSNKGIAGDPNNSRYSVTFVDNHDTGRDNNAIAKDWSAANAVILAMPGTPCVWIKHYNADKTNIKNMIYARRAAGVHNQSTITKGESSNGGYIIETQGNNGKVYVQLGGATNNGTPSGMKLVAQGDNYKFYCTSSLDITTPHKPSLPGGGGGGGTLPTGKTTIHIKASSAPTLYAWSDASGTSVELNGGWPGTTMTEKDSEGFWVKTFDTAPVNIVINNGSGSDSGKTPDITGLSGDVYYEYDGATTATATTGGGGGQTGGTTTIHVKAATAPTLYAWTDAGELNGGWPGTQMTEKDSDGNWVKTFNAAPINFILNDGTGADSGKTPDITGVSGDVYYTYDGATTATEGIEGGGGGETGGKTTIHVKADVAPTLYAWTDAGELNGGWPGTQMTEKDANGNWVKTFDVAPINFILNDGTGADSGKTPDITGVSGDVYYTYDGATTATEGIEGGGETGGKTTIHVKADVAPTLYAWTDAGELNGGWPGTQMTEKDANGNWVKTFDVAPINFILNDGTGADSGKTPDITGVSGDVYYTYDGATTATEGIEGGGETGGKTTIHVKADVAPTLYAWTDAGELNGGWPGTQMTEKDANGNWVKTFDVAPINFILNDGTGADSGKTPDITGVSGDVYYTYDGATTATEGIEGGGETGGKTTIHVKADVAPTLYAWTDAGELNGGWPGTQMTEKDSDGNWVKTFNAAPINFILNDGTGADSGKTPDITGVSGDVYYTYDGATTATEGIEGGGGGETGGKTTIHVKADVAPTLYAWTDAGELNGGWPGTQMTEKDANGNWVKTFDVAPINFILNDGTGADSGKTPDITGVSGDVYYTYDGATTATEGIEGGGETGGKTTIHVKADVAPTLYAWTDAGELNGGWPGTQMTEKDANGNWVKTFNAAPINFILNDGTGADSGKTPDITGVSGDVYYTYDGATTATEGIEGGGETGGTTTVYVQATSTPYLYAWTDTDFSVNGLWPGSAMTPATNLPSGAMAHVQSAGGSWYVATLNASPVNIVINDGTGEDSGKTSDIENLSGENYFIYDGATGYEVTTAPTLNSIDDVTKIYYDTVDVYSIDGQLVRKDAVAGEAMKTLKKGIYVINGKKVVVK